MGLGVDEDGKRRSNGHGQIVAESVVADALVAARRWHHVDGYCRVGHGERTEGAAVQGTDNGEQQEGRCRQVAGKEDGKGREADHQHRLARKGVDEIAAEWPEQQGSDGIARQHQPDDVLSGSKCLIEIKGQQWRQQVESGEQRKVGCHHLAIVTIPQPFHLYLLH